MSAPTTPREVVARQRCQGDQAAEFCAAPCGGCLMSADADLSALAAAGFAIVPKAGLDELARWCRPSPLDTDKDRARDLKQIGERVRRMLAASEGETR